MIQRLKLPFYLSIILLSILSCNNSPKVIESSDNADINNSRTGIFSQEKSSTEFKREDNLASKDILHKVKVNKILPTSKYLFINVNEEGTEEPFWIATRIMNIEVGQTYYYNGGLLKTNYESKEYNKVFKQIYLISSSLVRADHGSNPDVMNNSDKTVTKDKINNLPIESSTQLKPIIVKGSIRIADLVKNMKKYEGKTIQISGVCVKLNADIMNKNWIHIKDGSEDNYDLVVTSNEIVNEGNTVTMKAKVVLDKDYGSGYYYKLILEDGFVLQ